MPKSFLSNFKVQLLHKEINLIAQNYLASESIKLVEKYLHKDQFDKGYQVYWLWYYFVIFQLFDKNENIITKLENNEISISYFVEITTTRLKKIDNSILNNKFNEFIEECIKLKKYRKKMNLENSLQSLANNGLLSLMNLYNEERTIMLEEYIDIVSENNKKLIDLNIELTKLELGYNIKFQPNSRYEILFRRIKMLRKENSKVTENIRKTIKEFRGILPDLDILITKKNNVFEDVVEHIRRLYYASKISKT